MTIKVAINGFGRIARLVFRVIENRRLLGEDIRVVAINDLNMHPEYAIYLLTHDTVHGTTDYDCVIKSTSEHCSMIVNNNPVIIFNERNPVDIPWGSLDVDCVVESTGFFTTREKANAHITAGAKKVIISAPSKDVDMYVYGVNHQKYDPSQRIVSNASCTTNCLAPLAHVLHQNFGIVEGLMSTIHSTTSTQRTVDGSSVRNWRAGRSASSNIIPSSTGAAMAVGKVIPELDGKLTGMAFRVPTIDVSVVDLTVRTAKNTTLKEVFKAFRERSRGDLQGILKSTDQQLVSSDFIGASQSCIIDEQACMQIGDNFLKIVAWYDNEWGYSNRIVDLLMHVTSNSI